MELLNNLAIAAFTFLAAAGDVKNRKIPNRLILAGIGSACLIKAFQGFAFPAAEGGGPAALLQVIAGCAIPLLFPGVLYLCGALGAGDIKLFCMIGAFKGPRAVTEIILLSFFTGGAGAICILLGKKDAIRRISAITCRLIRILQGGETLKNLTDSGQMNRMIFSLPVMAALILYILGVRIL